jgi:hypothetical protein
MRMAVQWNSVREAVKNRFSCTRAAMKRKIQRDCYNSCVKSVSRKRVMETVID